MGYRSLVYLKTTTEGWILMKRFNDTIEKWEDKPLSYSEVYCSPAGNYKIEWIDVKWYDSFPSVRNVVKMMNRFDEEDIPYSFIRLGEETPDIEHRRNYPDDMPCEIECFEPVTDVNDEESGCYKKCEDHSSASTETKVPELDPAHVKSVLFDIFDEYKYDDDILAQLCSRKEDGVITLSEYATALANYNDWLDEWTESRD